MNVFDRSPRPRTVFVLCVVVASMLTYVAAEAASEHLSLPTPVLGPTADPTLENGYPLTTTDAAGTPGIVVDAGWTSFLWYGTGIVFNAEGPIRFSTDGPTTLRVTDDFCTGDQFRVYDNGVELGVNKQGRQQGRPTFDVEQNPGGAHDPGDVFADPKWSSGIYRLAPGDHEIVIQVVENPWGMGRAYLRVDSATPLATFELNSVESIIDPVHGLDQFRFYGRWAPGVGSDGVMPEIDDVVVWFGRHMEVLPAGSFSCNRWRCLYESTGPGIVRASITATAFVFEASEVDLCPGWRWMPVGVWFGDEGGDTAVRRYGTLSNPEP